MLSPLGGWVDGRWGGDAGGRRELLVMIGMPKVDR